MKKSMTIAMFAAASACAAQAPVAVTPDVEVATFASGLEHPWGLAFMPDGRALVTERPGRLRIVDRTGQLSPPLKGIPPVADDGQAGLLDVALDPDFAATPFVYLSYIEPGQGGGSRLVVAKGRFAEEGLADVRPIYARTDFVPGAANFGSRLLFAPDKTLFVTVGDRFAFRDKAQDLSSPLGKILRVNRDGSIPPDNPFADAGKDRLPEIWSYGHRNAQGAALHPETGKLWSVEHGARGGDEVNHPEAGKNYGWPVITYGRDYSGAKIGVGTHKAGMEQPVHYWDPSIAPSGMMFYTGAAFPQWKGDLFIGALQGMKLVRLTLNGDKVVKEEHLLGALDERIRDVRQGPDGLIYCLTDNQAGRILRLQPKSP